MHPGPAGYFPRGDGKVDQGQPQTLAGVLFQGVEAGVKAAAQIDDGLDPLRLPLLQLEGPGLIGADQFVRHPVGVAEPQAQIGMVLPEIIQIGPKSALLGG